MSNVWFTSDLHIGHALVARERMAPVIAAVVDAVALVTDAAPTQLSEPDTIALHDNALAAAWDGLVGPKDQVWVLGDISAGGTAAQERALIWLTQRPGEKHLVSGNHDGCHPMYRDAHKWQRKYLSWRAFVSVQAFARRRIAGRSVLMSHFPYHTDHTTVSRFTQYRLRDEGEPLLHGHTHSHRRANGWEFHVGPDAWGLRPVHIDELAAMIRARLAAEGDQR